MCCVTGGDPHRWVETASCETMEKCSRTLADFPLLIEQEVRPANFQKPDNPAQTATIR